MSSYGAVLTVAMVFAACADQKTTTSQDTSIGISDAGSDAGSDFGADASTPDIPLRVDDLAPSETADTTDASAADCLARPDDPIILTTPVGPIAEGCCASADLSPLPTPVSTLDLRNVATLQGATCGDQTTTPSNEYGVELPSDPSAYPLEIITPAVSLADPACEALCSASGDAPVTAFGFGVKSHHVIGFAQGRGLVVYAPKPWYFVSGGCGEACAWPCLTGYQEFGVHGCVAIGHGSFGLATAEANAPSVSVIVDLVQIDDLPAGGCCPFVP